MADSSCFTSGVLRGKGSTPAIQICRSFTEERHRARYIASLRQTQLITPLFFENQIIWCSPENEKARKYFICRLLSKLGIATGRE